MRISAFYLEDVKDRDGVSFKDPMVSGTLYELADEDFVEPTPPPPVEPESNVEDPRSPPPQAGPPLPSPPATFRFRAITRPSHEIYFSFNVIAGRYYPDILQSPLLANVLTRENVERTIEVSADPRGAGDCRHVVAVRTLLSLGGLSIGALCATDALFWKEGRGPIFNAAWTVARQELEEYMSGRYGGLDVASGAEAVFVNDDMGLQPEVLSTPLGAVIWGGGTTEDPIVIDDD